MADTFSNIMFGHFSVFVPQQLLRMGQIPGVAASLDADVAELERHAGRVAGRVEAPAQGQQAKRLAVVVLDQVGALPHPRGGR